MKDLIIVKSTIMSSLLNFFALIIWIKSSTELTSVKIAGLIIKPKPFNSSNSQLNNSYNQQSETRLNWKRAEPPTRWWLPDLPERFGWMRRESTWASCTSTGTSGRPEYGSRRRKLRQPWKNRSCWIVWDNIFKSYFFKF